ncbi:MAG: serine hydrolase [Vulcanimicrobiaceae bacterium]
MRRSAFIASAFACALPQFADAATIDQKIERIERWSTGRISAVAQRIGDAAPAVSYHPGVVAPAASTIKLVILETVFAAADSDATILHAKIPIRGSDIVGGSDRYAHAVPGRRYAIGPILHAMIAQSDNTAANALITYLGFARINQTAQALGMSATRLGRHFSDSPPVWRISENRTSAADLATIVLDIARGARSGNSQLVSQAGCKHMLALMLDQEDHTKIARGLPPGTRLANKTGEVSHVRNDVGIVDPGRTGEYVIAVIVHGLDYDGRGDEAIARVTHAIDPIMRPVR